MRMEEYLLKSGVTTVHQVTDALERQRDSRPPLGEIALQQGLMKPRAIQTVLLWQRFERLRPFGEIAVELGYITKHKLEQLLAVQGQTSKPLLRVLVEMGVIDEATAEHIELDFAWNSFDRNYFGEGQSEASAQTVAS